MASSCPTNRLYDQPVSGMAASATTSEIAVLRVLVILPIVKCKVTAGHQPEPPPPPPLLPPPNPPKPPPKPPPPKPPPRPPPNGPTPLDHRLHGPRPQS